MDGNYSSTRISPGLHISEFSIGLINCTKNVHQLCPINSPYVPGSARVMGIIS